MSNQTPQNHRIVFAVCFFDPDPPPYPIAGDFMKCIFLSKINLKMFFKEINVILLSYISYSGCGVK